jgi:tetratricopeptide (TPR) repeat protein
MDVWKPRREDGSLETLSDWYVMSERWPQPGNEHDFEEFCLLFLKELWKNPFLELHGRRGQVQFGVDIFDPMVTTPHKAAQCKHHESHIVLGDTEVQNEVNKALNFKPPLKLFAILTTGKKSVDTDEMVRLINKRHAKAKLFKVKIHYWNEICLTLDSPEFEDVALTLIPGGIRARLKHQETEIDSLRQTQSKLIESISSSAGGTSHDAELDLAEADIKARNPEKARFALDRIQQRYGQSLSPQQQFRLFISYANLELMEGRNSQAGDFVLKAHRIFPDNERSQINEVLGYELTGDKDHAYALALERLKVYPSATTLIACQIRTAPEEISPADLEADSTPQHSDDVEVWMALSVRAIRRNNFVDAERYARKAATLAPDLFAPRSILGEALLNQAAPKPYSVAWHRGVTINADKLTDAVATLTQAVFLAQSQHLHVFLCESLIFRAQAYVHQGKIDQADDDFRRAIQAMPNSAIAHRRYANFLYFSKKQPQEAAFQLRKAIALGDDLMAEHFLAGILSESEEPSDRRAAAELFSRLTQTLYAGLATTTDALTAKNNRALAVGGFQSAIELLVAARQFDDADKLIEAVSGGCLGEITILTARSTVALARTNTQTAASFAEEAFQLVTVDSSEHDVRALALQMGRLKLWESTLTLWLQLHEKVGIGSDAHRLIYCAKLLHRYDVIIRIGKDVRQSGMADTWIRYQEIQALEQFDLDQAIILLTEMIANTPEEGHPRWNLSYLGLRWLKRDLIDPCPEALSPVEDATPEEGFLAVEIMRRYGDPNVALRYAYELVRRHPSSPDAQAAFSCLFHMPGSLRPTINEPGAVVKGSAVRVKEREQMRWMIIEDSPDPRSAFNEFSPDSAIATELLNKHVGDEVTLSQSSGRPRTGIIEEIVSKYTYLFRDILANWQIRFNDRNYIQAFTVMQTDPVTGEPVHDFTDIELAVDGQLDHRTKVNATYKTSWMPIDNYARLIGATPFQAFCHLASDLDLFVRCNGVGTDRAVAVNSLKHCHTIVFDITSLALIYLLDLSEFLKQWSGTLVISQHTALELRKTEQEFAHRLGGLSYFSKYNNKYIIYEVSPEFSQSQHDAFVAFQDFVFAHFVVRNCLPLAELEPNERKQGESLFSQHGMESIFLAKEAGHVLLTEDFSVAIGAARHSARRAWIQTLVMYFNTIGIATEDDWATVGAKLMGYDVRDTAYDARTLVRAGELANWNLDRWPFNKAIELYIACPNDHVFLIISAHIIRALYYNSASTFGRSAHIAAFLERLAVHPRRFSQLANLPALVEQCFSFDVFPGREARDVVLAWLLKATPAAYFAT